MPEVFQYVYSTPLINYQLTYRFYVTSINFNGESQPSAIVGLTPCTAPSGLNSPVILDVT